jgi:hypothetical protein
MPVPHETAKNAAAKVTTNFQLNGSFAYTEATVASFQLDAGSRLVPLLRRPYRCELLTRS